MKVWVNLNISHYPQPPPHNHTYYYQNYSWRQFHKQIPPFNYTAHRVLHLIPVLCFVPNPIMCSWMWVITTAFHIFPFTPGNGLSWKLIAFISLMCILGLPEQHREFSCFLVLDPVLILVSLPCVNVNLCLPSSFIICGRYFFLFTPFAVKCTWE